MSFDGRGGRSGVQWTQHHSWTSSIGIKSIFCREEDRGKQRGGTIPSSYLLTVFPTFWSQDAGKKGFSHSYLGLKGLTGDNPVLFESHLEDKEGLKRNGAGHHTPVVCLSETFITSSFLSNSTILKTWLRVSPFTFQPQKNVFWWVFRWVSFLYIWISTSSKCPYSRRTRTMSSMPSRLGIKRFLCSYWIHWAWSRRKSFEVHAWTWSASVWIELSTQRVSWPYETPNRWSED